MASTTAILDDGAALPVSLTRRRMLRAAAIALIAVLAGGLVYLRAWPPFATVMSASMAPTIETGDVVVLKRIDGPPRVGDVISVSVPEEARSRYGYPPTVIHRVVAIRPDGQITTKGDARREPDPFTVPVNAVDTKVVATVPAAGRLMAFLTSTMGLLWLAAGVLLLIVLPLVERQREAQRRGQNGMEELQTEVRALTDELVRLQYEVSARDRAQATLEATLAALPELIRTEMERAIEAAAPADPPAAPQPPPAPAPAPAERPAQSGFLRSAVRRARASRRVN